MHPTFASAPGGRELDLENDSLLNEQATDDSADPTVQKGELCNLGATRKGLS